MVKSELWRACDLLVWKSECKLFRKRKIRAPSFSISEPELQACLLSFNIFKAYLSINEIENPSFWPSNNQNSELPSLEEKKFDPRHFGAELFELQQNLPSFAFSNRPFHTPSHIHVSHAWYSLMTFLPLLGAPQEMTIYFLLVNYVKKKLKITLVFWYFSFKTKLITSASISVYIHAHDIRVHMT